MSTTTTPITGVTRTERTMRVERELPENGDYQLRVHRQAKTVAGDIVLGREDLMYAYNDSVANTLPRVATATYLAACQAAKTVLDLMAAEKQWYDNLVAEVRAEAQAADAEAKASANAPPVA